MKILGILSNNYALSVITKLLTALIGLVTSMLCTRYLGIEYKGEYAYITQLSNIFVIILNMGIFQSYSLNYKKHGSDTLKKYNDICVLQFLTLFIVSIALLSILKDTVLTLVIILVPFNVLKLQYENFVLIEKLQLRMKLHIFNTTLQAACFLVLYFFCETKLEYIVGLTVLIDLITIVFYSIGLKYLPKVWQADFTFLKSVLKFGFVPMLSGFLLIINYSVDIIFLKHIGISQELSYYSLAVNVINYVWMIPDAFKDVLFSKSARKFDKDSILLSTQISTSFILLCLIGFALLGKRFISILFSVEYLPSYGVTIVLFFGAFSMSIFKLLGVVLISQGKRMVNFISLVTSAGLNIILNILTIPVWGMYGAAIASVCSYSLSAIILLLYFKKLYKISVFELLVPGKQMFLFIKSKI